MERLHILIKIATKRSLERLACRYGRTISSMIEILVNEENFRIVSSLNEHDLNKYFNEEPNQIDGKQA